MKILTQLLSFPMAVVTAVSSSFKSNDAVLTEIMEFTNITDIEIRRAIIGDLFSMAVPEMYNQCDKETLFTLQLSLSLYRQIDQKDSLINLTLDALLDSSATHEKKLTEANTKFIYETKDIPCSDHPSTIDFTDDDGEVMSMTPDELCTNLMTAKIIHQLIKVLSYGQHGAPAFMQYAIATTLSIVHIDVDAGDVRKCMTVDQTIFLARIHDRVMQYKNATEANPVVLYT
jgi:hypothetical protein